MEQHSRIVSAPICSIAHNRRAKPIYGVGTDLMRAPGFRDETDDGAAPDDTELLPIGVRRFAPLIGYHAPAGRLGAELAQRQLDHAAVRLWHAFHQRDIVFHHGTRLKRLLKPRMSLGIARKQQAARGVTIKPVHRAWPSPETEFERIEMVFERKRTVTRRINGQASGLVDDNRLAIEE